MGTSVRVFSFVVACSAAALAVADDASPTAPAADAAKAVAVAPAGPVAAAPAAVPAAPAVAPAVSVKSVLPAGAVATSGTRSEDIKGQRYGVKLRNGREVVGVVRPGDPWEVRDDGAGLHARPKTPGDRTGLRLWFVGNSNGFVTLDAADIEKIRGIGALEAADSERISGAIAGAEDRAAAERRRIRLVRSNVESGYVRDVMAESLAASVRTRAEEEGKALGDLLVRFPPSRWTVDTPLEIARRQRDQNIQPTEEEKEFLRVFDDWKLAVRIWNSVGTQPAPAPVPAR